MAFFSVDGSCAATNARARCCLWLWQLVSQRPADTSVSVDRKTSSSRSTARACALRTSHSGAQSPCRPHFLRTRRLERQPETLERFAPIHNDALCADGSRVPTFASRLQLAQPKGARLLDVDPDGLTRWLVALREAGAHRPRLRPTPRRCSALCPHPRLA